VKIDLLWTLQSCIAQYVCAEVGLPNQITRDWWDTNLSVIASRLRYLPLWTSNWDGILWDQPVVTSPWFCLWAKLCRCCSWTGKPLAVKIAAHSPSPRLPACCVRGWQEGPHCLLLQFPPQVQVQAPPACWKGQWVTSGAVLPTAREKEEDCWGLQCLKSLKEPSCNSLNGNWDCLSCVWLKYLPQPVYLHQRFVQTGFGVFVTMDQLRYGSSQHSGLCWSIFFTRLRHPSWILLWSGMESLLLVFLEFRQFCPDVNSLAVSGWPGLTEHKWHKRWVWEVEIA